MQFDLLITILSFLLLLSDSSVDIWPCECDFHNLGICSDVSIDECLVEVQAQVMAWDDKFNGWIPYEDGGVSYVSLYQKVHFVPGSNGEQSPLAERRMRRAAQQRPSPLVRQSPVASIVERRSAVADQRRLMPKYEYTVESCHLVDKRVLLRCTVTKDMNYHQVMPTFHHWQIGEEKYGLKFMTTVEACQFHNKLQKAIEHLTRQSKSSSDESNVDVTDLEDDVFMPLTLPLNGNNGLSKFRPYVRSSAPASSAIYLPYTPPTPTNGALIRPPKSKTMMPLEQEPQPTSVPSTVPRSDRRAVAPVYMPSAITTAQQAPAPPSAQVLTKAEISSIVAGRSGPPAAMLPLKPLAWKPETTVRMYGRARTEPGIEKAIVEEEPDSGGAQSHSYIEKATRYKRSSVASVVRLPGMLPLIPPTATAGGPLSSKAAKKGGAQSSVSFSSLSQIVRREQCKYCRQYYYLRDNVRGACPEAPDLCRVWSRRLTCVQCAETVAYKYCPSTRSGATRSQERCRRYWRWFIFSLLAILLPCMWCYPVAWLCGRCCWFCGVIDKRHEPAHISTTSSASPKWSRQKRSALLYR